VARGESMTSKEPISIAEPSPAYAGVSLSLAKTEMNARGLHKPNGLRLGDYNYFVHIFSCWFELRLP
jgi:hypothetical protein